MTLPYYSNEEIKSKKEEISTNLGNANYFTRIGKVQELIKRENKDIKILELGCGRGKLSRDLMDEGYKNLTLVDIDNYTEGLEVDLKDLSFDKLDYPNNEFDLVLAIAIIEHLENNGAKKAMLSGSGATVIGFCPDKKIADNFTKYYSKKNYWNCITKTKRSSK